MRKIKIVLLILSLLIFVSCEEKEDIDTQSSATGVYEGSKTGEVTDADRQFGKLRKGKENKSNENKKIDKTVRPEIAKFVEEQFNDSTKIYKISDLEYSINEKAITTMFKNDAKHILKNASYEYSIEVKQLKDKYNINEFVEKSKNDKPELKAVEMKFYDIVLVNNINNNDHSGELTTIINKNDKSYLIKISSEYLKISEVLMLAEKFSEYIK